MKREYFKIRETRKRKFGEVELSCTQMSVPDSLDLWTRLGALVGQDIIQLILSASEKEAKAITDNKEIVAQIVTGILNNAQEGQLKILPEIIEKSNVTIDEITIEGEKMVDMKLHLCLGLIEPMEMFEIVLWCLGVSFETP